MQLLKNSQRKFSEKPLYLLRRKKIDEVAGKKGVDEGRVAGVGEEALCGADERFDK